MARGQTLEDLDSAPRQGPDTVELPPGTQLAGRFELLGVLGRGAASVVYQARDLALQEVVAVKLLDTRDGGFERLSREVRLARRVTHPNVCRVHDLVEHPRGALLAMELVPGETLAEALQRGLGPAALRHVISGVLDGLEAVHRAGIVHRDLKPANVLLARDGRVVLTDFGIARLAGAAGGHATGAQVGTPAYMAPEQLLGEPVDARTDLYALGLVLHEALTGRLPFQAPGEALEPPVVLRRLREAAPPALAHPWHEALQRLLAREPSVRPATVAEARALLDLGAVPARAAPRRFGFLVAALVLALAGALSVVAWRVAGDRPEDPAEASPELPDAQFLLPSEVFAWTPPGVIQTFGGWYVAIAEGPSDRDGLASVTLGLDGRRLRARVVRGTHPALARELVPGAELFCLAQGPPAGPAAARHLSWTRGTVLGLEGDRVLLRRSDARFNPRACRWIPPGSP
ncbi:MAG: serine/threonine protein kinase [Deltaproteobacteria bacterium]|nr:serine/threonine protein kinase [Deltaproteobacteria bacterium]